MSWTATSASPFATSSAAAPSGIVLLFARTCSPIPRGEHSNLICTDAVGETVFALDLHSCGDLVDPLRGAVLDRRPVIYVLSNGVLVAHAPPEDAMILKSETYHFHRLDLTRQAGFIVTIYDEDGLRLAGTQPMPTPARAFEEARKIVDNKVEGPKKLKVPPSIMPP
jgi:hypothetical protein